MDGQETKRENTIYNELFQVPKDAAWLNKLNPLKCIFESNDTNVKCHKNMTKEIQMRHVGAITAYKRADFFVLKFGQVCED